MVRSFGPVAILAALCLSGCERPPGERSPAVPPGAGAGEPSTADPPRAVHDVPTHEGGVAPDTKPSVRGERVAIVPEAHALHGRLEMPDMPNACQDDEDCHVGGCSGEVCSAEPEVITTCEVLPIRFPDGSRCGCVDRSCRWWHPEGAALVEMGADTERPKPRSGDAPVEALATCGSQSCKPGQECVSYYGVAGVQGPRIHSCEWRCRPSQPNGGCPSGTKCLTLADGPGRVCR